MNDTNMNGSDETRRKRARFRSWHRGMREVDLILGTFADRNIMDLNATDLDQYERLLDVLDADLLRWVTGEAPVPQQYDTALFRAIVAQTASTALD